MVMWVSKVLLKWWHKNYSLHHCKLVWKFPFSRDEQNLLFRSPAIMQEFWLVKAVVNVNTLSNSACDYLMNCKYLVKAQTENRCSLLPRLHFPLSWILFYLLYGYYNGCHQALPLQCANRDSQKCLINYINGKADEHMKRRCKTH